VTEKQKYLGVIFDSTMSWSHHVSNVCSKTSYYLCLLRSHRHVIDNSLMKMLLESLHGVVSFVLLCNSLGSIFGKHLISEASTDAESCSAAMLWTKERQSCD